MSRFLECVAALALMTAPVAAEGLGLGRPALPEEVAAWDIDVRPDGAGLPEGRGDVWMGEELYEAQCAHCHGTFGEAVGGWPKLAGGDGTLADEHPEKTIGSYWPYASTVFDYVNRAMPYGYAQSLSADEVYAITAYLLYLNFLVDDDFELSHENFADLRLLNEDGFYLDDRKEVEWPTFTQAPCMSDCKPEVRITMRAAVLDVTPDDPTATARREQARAMAAASGGAGADGSGALVPEAAPEPEAAAEPEVPRYTDAQIAAGERVFRTCQACHQVGERARNAVGPVLFGVLGGPAGAVDGFRYSAPMQARADEGLVWTPEEMDAFLADPRGYLPRTSMAFAGVRSAEDRQAVIAYLSSLAP